MYVLLNLSHYVKSYGLLCQILAFFTTPAPQIWPCHVTQEAQFEKIIVFPNSAFNIRKSYKISGREALYFRSYQPKTSRGRGWKTPPSAFRVISGVTHSSAMSLSVNLGWPTLFLGQLTFWYEYGISQCFC